VKRRFVDNPFLVLAVPPDASRAELEGAGQKLLAMLDLGLDGASAYATPFGEARRSADDVRRALAELRDPAKRLEHELWARVPPAPGQRAPRPAGWTGARGKLGLGRR
jgi:hypothetical protein